MKNNVTKLDSGLLKLKIKKILECIVFDAREYLNMDERLDSYTEKIMKLKK
jgi:hypothetical protein